MTSDLDESGHYILQNHMLVTLRFSKVSELRMQDFLEENIVLDLEILLSPPSTSHTFEVKLSPFYGLETSFLCQRIEVVGVQPCDLNGKL